MMIMEGSMSKTEYDLKAMMYSSYDKPHKLCNVSGSRLSGNPDYHPIWLIRKDSKCRLWLTQEQFEEPIS